MAQQLIFDLRALLGESYHLHQCIRPCPLRKRPTTNIAQTCRTLSCPRLPDSLIDLEVYENPLASNPTGSNPWLCGKSRGKQPWGTPVKVKLLRPPRQSRGNS